jgi:ubiquinone/menaquinone biosynthesis C-methylase UbiE
LERIDFEKKMKKLPYLNLGCGNRFIESWINFDFVSDNEQVVQTDLIKGIPLKSDSVEVVYHSHVLEHFSKDDGNYFISECYRVLKPSGIIRIAVPDLEKSVRQYLKDLESVISDDSEINRENYNWGIIELFDQMIRNQSGGEMAKYWTKINLINEKHITERVGYEFRNFRQQYLKSIKETTGLQDVPNRQKRPTMAARVKSKIRRTFFPKDDMEMKYASIGRFRSSGEIHKWMYDSYSLKALLIKNGFKDVSVKDAFNSSIVNWQEFISLDVENGEVRKPDSLFMEATK